MITKSLRPFKTDLQHQYPQGISSEKGSVKLSQEVLAISKQVGSFITAASTSEHIDVPNVTFRQAELDSLLQTVLESLTRYEGSIRFVAPVCPDYAQESSDAFYQTIGEGISPQAKAAMRAARVLVEISKKVGLTPQIDILIADTEDDLPEVMQRCVAGSAEEYRRRCQSSVSQIRQHMEACHQVSVSTFTEGLGPDFRNTQYSYESVINNLRIADEKIAAEVEKMGEQRMQRHSKILGRPEQDYELTVRYMAQYAALGTLLRSLNEPTVLLNYPTPNLPFFNAAKYRSTDFSISKRDVKVLPVITTVL